MPRIGEPLVLATRIYQHATRIRVVAKYRSVQKEKSFPLETDLSVLLKWQKRTEATLIDTAPAKASRYALEADVPTYLGMLTGRRKKDERALLQHWLDADHYADPLPTKPLGAVPRLHISRAMLRTQIAWWIEQGNAASSINHRVRAIRNLYRELDGEEADNPADKIKKLKEPEPQARGQSYDLIEAIIAFMPDRGRAVKGGVQTGISLGKRRARVMAWTGLPPAQVMQLRRVHFNRQAGTVVVQPRRKGKGTRVVTLPLLPQAVEALQGFFDAGAEGRFNTSAFYQQWKRAQLALEAALRESVAKAGGAPATITVPRIRPYDLRHSFGTEVFRRSRDLMAVRKLLMHAKTTTSERYVEGAVDEAAQRAIDLWREVR